MSCTLSLFLLLTEQGGFSETLLVDFCHKGIPLPICLFERTFRRFLLLMHRRLVFERVFVQHFVLSFPIFESISIAPIIVKFVHYRSLVVIGSHALIFDVDLIEAALVNQSVVLVIANLTLLTGLKLLPGLLLDHSGVSI